MPQRLTQEGKKIIVTIEMFGNTYVRDISKTSAKIFFDVDESLNFAAWEGLSLGNKTFCLDFECLTIDCQAWSTFLLNVLPGFWQHHHWDCLRPKTLNKSWIFLTAWNLSSIDVNIVFLIFMSTFKAFLNHSSHVMLASNLWVLKFFAAVKLNVNTKIGWLSLKLSS